MIRVGRLLSFAILLTVLDSRGAVQAAPLDTIADAVVGKPDLTTTYGSVGTSAADMDDPRSVAIDPNSGRLFVVDDARVLSWPSAATFTNGQAPDLVLGKPDFTTNFDLDYSATNIIVPRAVTVDSAGNVYVADAFVHRVLRFRPPFSNGMAADLVIGQPNFQTGDPNLFDVSAATLNSPSGVAIDTHGHLWVSDTYNVRVLRYSPPFFNGMAADRVIGQPDFTSNIPNYGGSFPMPGADISATGLYYASKINFDAAGNFYVSDRLNDRVLRFTPPFSDGMAANLVIGQRDFTTADPNLVTGPSGLRTPDGSAVDPAGNLYIADAANNRVLQYTPPLSNGMAASRVFGEPNFTSSCQYLCSGSASASSLTLPADVAVDGVGNVYIVDFQRLLRYDQPLALPATLVAAVLPSSRSVQVGATATAFATIINAGTTTATSCGIALLSSIPANVSYQTTNPATNQVTGTPNTPVDIGAGLFQSYVFALTPTAPIAPTDVQFTFGCTNTGPVANVSGVNTLLFLGSAGPTSDIVALAGTVNNDGIVNIPGTCGTGVFVVATVNVGVSATITASVDTGGTTLPVILSICKTNPATGVCLAPPSVNVTTTINANATPTFGVFVAGSGNVPFDPAANRVFVRFKDSGDVTRGSTSVAVRTQ